MPSIVFINRYFYPDHSATSQILSDLAFHLAECGYNINVITSRQLYDDTSRELPAFEEIDSVSVTRIRTTRFGRGNLLGRAIDYLSFYISAFIVLLKMVKKEDYLVAKTDPPMISVIASIVARFKSAKLINWTQDLFPEVGTELGISILEYTKPVLLKFRNSALKNAWMNVVIGATMKERLVASGVDESKITIIPNWSNGNLIYPVPSSENVLRQKWGLTDKFVIGYSGNMGRAHEFETIMDIAETLKNEHEIVFLFIGSGAKRQWIENETKKRGLTNIIFKPYQDRDLLHLSLSLPDVHFISLLPNLEGLIVPSKYYGVAAAGRPCLFIGDTEGEISLILDKYNCGYAISQGDVEKGVAFIRSIKNNSIIYNDMCMNARNMYCENFDTGAAFKKWKTLFSDLDSSFQKSRIIG